MPDREKVIKGLEQCKEGGSCDGCQYDINSSKCIFLLHADALALLKEQEAVVRCKDCEYYDYHNGCMSWHDVNSKNDNWYCADGERRMDDA